MVAGMLLLTDDCVNNTTISGLIGVLLQLSPCFCGIFSFSGPAALSTNDALLSGEERGTEARKKRVVLWSTIFLKTAFPDK